MPALAPGILARGPWDLSQVRSRWLEETYDPGADAAAEADRAIEALRDRGSPSHDGLSARLAGWEQRPDGLDLELQPSRWALRLIGGGSESLAVLCVTRDAEGRWLAGRRAAWLASWAGRWALGAGGAVDLGEHAPDALARELREEWGVAPERIRAEALVRVPTGVVLLVGQAWLPAGAEIVMDDEHDDFAWWPADVDDWPDEADAPLRTMARLLA
jgi:ADP-ribose pyrophosphatase YjhB (NUDIX family)